ncbi:hypothetical protein GR212_15885 [Rhizobium lusitanum]|uniref:Exonuclease domain-containing protein n=1 Tax=Rhizobium lusitanum TaxID=293958 RepID=A0A6L9UAB2_9HYPH|nr:hypothetical protein [Rhizobium lusitanum]NEI71060.1 hypothetical protein [Rhizobium lusitanum]
MTAAPIAIPNILFLDLQTSGLYLRNESIDSNQQPWAPYIAAMQCNGGGQVINHFAAFIKPDGRMVKGGALEKHGIDHKLCGRVGIPESRALGILSDMLKVGPFESEMKVVTYGDMDKMVVASLFARFAVSLSKPSSAFDRLWLTRPMTTFIDLQKPYAQQICKLESEVSDATEYRWPRFGEAVEGILGRQPNEHRDSLQDILLLKEMYFDLARRGFFPEVNAA